MISKFLQPLKALFPILVTVIGIVIVLNLTQFLNVSDSIFVTLLGISNADKLSHYWYLQPIITQYFIDNKSEIWLLFLIAHSKR